MPHSRAIPIRRYAPGDEHAIASIFVRAIHDVAIIDYSRQQCDAWSGRRPNVEHWAERCQQKQPFVAELEGRVAGFCELDPDGHIDCTYVDPDYMRRGVGSALVNAAIAHAQQDGVERMTVEASLTARPLFERAGFQIVERQTVRIGEVELTNFRMELRLRPDR